jgi:hypothetical protein
VSTLALVTIQVWAAATEIDALVSGDVSMCIPQDRSQSAHIGLGQE